MQIAVILIAIAVWLIIFWLGSISLEATGMERTKARFQVLSAITGTGFTTREAESIVNHPTRRRIATWMILLGNTGIMAFIVGLILFIRSGVKSPSPLQIGIILAVIIVLILFIRLGVVDKLTAGILRIVRRGRPTSHLVAEEVLHQAGEYGVARIAAGEKNRAASYALKDAVLSERGIMILAIERKDTVLTFPEAEETVVAGDYLLCYGKVAEIISMTR